jgi:deazaflavin-dependent oxidoreductase (nitroreductase family)
MTMANWLAFTRAHCSVYRATHGLVGGNLLGMRMLLLTTRGRKTGRRRTLPLAFVEYRGDYVVVASNGGSERSPAWWLNLQAAETAEIQVGGERLEVEWDCAPQEDRMEYWRRLQAAIPAYRVYRTRTDREIPIVRLRQRDETRVLGFAGSWQEAPRVASAGG